MTCEVSELVRGRQRRSLSSPACGLFSHSIEQVCTQTSTRRGFCAPWSTLLPAPGLLPPLPVPAPCVAPLGASPMPASSFSLTFEVQFHKALSSLNTPNHASLPKYLLCLWAPGSARSFLKFLLFNTMALNFILCLFMSYSIPYPYCLDTQIKAEQMKRYRSHHGTVFLWLSTRTARQFLYTPLEVLSNNLMTE